MPIPKQLYLIKFYSIRFHNELLTSNKGCQYLRKNFFTYLVSNTLSHQFKYQIITHYVNQFHYAIIAVQFLMIFEEIPQINAKSFTRHSKIKLSAFKKNDKSTCLFTRLRPGSPFFFIFGPLPHPLKVTTWSSWLNMRWKEMDRGC